VFKKALAYFERAKEYYTLDGFVTEHFDLLQDIGALYLALIPFHTNITRIWYTTRFISLVIDVCTAASYTRRG
jgi:hypothetical protein